MSEQEEQAAHLARVSGRIGQAVREFCSMNKAFHADTLRAYVIESTGITAPASADRVLRELRAKKLINYRVVNRRKSLYEVIEVEQ